MNLSKNIPLKNVSENNSKKLSSIYIKFLKEYGPQGWWPINNVYHKEDFSYPKNSIQRFEVCVGAILTQNTSWKNVEKALDSLRSKKLLNPKKILECKDEDLAIIIRSAGYHNQKTKKLKIFSKFYIKLKNKIPSREELLNIWGIGPETCDSILLYAYNLPEFVVDAYTRRLLLQLKIIDESYSYMDIKNLFEKNLPKDFKLYQEYHALIVENGKYLRK